MPFYTTLGRNNCFGTEKINPKPVDFHGRKYYFKRKPKPKQDDFGDTKFSGKTVDQFKVEWQGLKSKLKYDKIKTNMQNKKLKKERKRKKRLQEKAMSEGFSF